jgi:hypothetical protein
VRLYLDGRSIQSGDQVQGVGDNFQGWIRHVARLFGAATF